MILPVGDIGPIMGEDEIKKQIEIIKKVTADLLTQGPEACRQFLIDAGIIKSSSYP